MKKQDLINLAGVLKGKNTKKVLNNYMYFLAENKVNILDVNSRSGYINIQYKTKTGKKIYNLYIDNTLLRSNQAIISIN